MKVELTKDWCTNMARLEDDASERWSVDDVLLVVSTYGPWGADLNGVHKQEIILADEVLRLRESEKALVATLRDEMDEGLRLRELGGRPAGRGDHGHDRAHRRRERAATRRTCAAGCRREVGAACAHRLGG